VFYFFTELNIQHNIVLIKRVTTFGRKSQIGSSNYNVHFLLLSNNFFMQRNCSTSNSFQSWVWKYKFHVLIRPFHSSGFQPLSCRDQFCNAI